MTAPSERTRVRRKPERSAHDRATVEAILDQALLAHVGINTDEGPVVIPMVIVRSGALLYLHGSPASRLLRSLATGVEVCVTVTLVDGLVLARSHFHHSVNYRSVVVFGVAEEVTDLDDKRAALAALVDHVQPGRAEDARPPTDHELRATRVVAIDLGEASVKTRSGPAIEEPEDLDLAIWAGEIPLRITRARPVPDESCTQPLPPYLVEASGS